MPQSVLPLNAQRCSVIMTVNNDQLDKVTDLHDNDFLALLQQRFGYRLGRFVQTGQRSQFPLRRITADTHSVGRTLLIGNALHYLHPVSGQGLNLAIRDIAALAELLSSGDYSDPADAALMKKFGRRRDADHKLVGRFTDTLARLFCIPVTPLAHARAVGLIATDLIPFIRHQLARQSMGLSVPLPHL